MKKQGVYFLYSAILLISMMFTITQINTISALELNTNAESNVVIGKQITPTGTINQNITNNYYNGSAYNETYNNILNQNCPVGYVVNGTYQNGTFKCTQSSGVFNTTNICYLNNSQTFIGQNVMNKTIFNNSLETSNTKLWALRVIGRGRGGYADGAMFEWYSAVTGAKLGELSCDSTSTCGYGILNLFGNTSIAGTGNRLAEFSFIDLAQTDSDKRGATLSVDCTSINNCGYNFLTTSAGSFRYAARYWPNGNVTMPYDVDIGDDLRVTGKYYGDGQYLSNLCLSNGTGCPAFGEGSVNGTGLTQYLTYWDTDNTINYVNGLFYNAGANTLTFDNLNIMFSRPSGVPHDYELYDDGFQSWYYGTDGTAGLNCYYVRSASNNTIRLCSDDTLHTRQINSTSVNATYFNGDGSGLTNIPIYNSTYATWAYNQTYSGSTYNATYATWAYNQTCIGKTLFNTTFCKAINGGTTQSCFITAPSGQVDIEVGGWVNGTTTHVFQTLYVNNGVAAMNAHSRAAGANPTNLFLQNVSYPTTTTLYNATVATSGGVLNWVTIKMEAYKSC